MDFDMVPAMADFRDEEAEADTVWMDPYGQAVGQNSFQDWQVGILTFLTKIHDYCFRILCQRNIKTTSDLEQKYLQFCNKTYQLFKEIIDINVFYFASMK